MSAADKLKQEVVDLAAAQARLEKHRTTEDEAIESGEDAWERWRRELIPILHQSELLM
jgi:hypothetical protein